MSSLCPFRFLLFTCTYVCLTIRAIAQQPELTLARPSLVREGDAPKAGYVEIPSALNQDLSVSISSSDPNQAIVPSTVTILAGQTRADYSITAVDDSLQDGSPQVTFTFVAPGYPTKSLTMPIEDNDLHHFEISTIPSPQIRNAPVNVQIRARAIDGRLISNFAGTANLAATSATGAIPCQPATTGAFFGEGVWAGEVSFDAYANGVALAVTSGGVSTISNSFALERGPHSRFGWSPLSSDQVVDTPVPVTIRAEDAGGNFVEEFTGTADLAAVTERIHPGDSSPFYNSGYHAPSAAQRQGRMSVVYTPAEVGNAGSLTGLEIFFEGVSGGLVYLPNYTIRMKHTSLEGVSSWDNAGWTTVYRHTGKASAGGWARLSFSEPFEYDGTSNLLIDFSYDNPDFRLHGFARYRASSSSSYFRGIAWDSPGELGNPLLWTDSTVSRSPFISKPLLRFASSMRVPIRPTTAGVFQGGLWNGSVSVASPLAEARFSARDAGGREGLSNAVKVTGATWPAGAAPIYRELFESEPLAAAWSFTGTQNFRTVVTDADQPHQSQRCLRMDTPWSLPTRNEATWTVDLTGRKQVVLKFWAKRYSPSIAGAPSIPFLNNGNFDGVAVSTDGTYWYEVQSMRALTGDWIQYAVDLDSAVLGRGLSYNSAFKIRFNRYGSTGAPSGGIMVDDIEIFSAPHPSALRVEVPAQIFEGGVPGRGSVKLPFAQAVDTFVSLQNSAPAKFAIPAQVTIPGGHLAGYFQIVPLNDTIADGNKIGAIGASHPYLLPGGATLGVIDDDLTNIALSVATSNVPEGTGTLLAVVSIQPAPAAPMKLAMASSDHSAVRVPANLQVPAGVARAVVPLTIVDDSKVDGSQTATVTLTGPSGLSAVQTITVVDDESANLRFSYPASKPVTAMAEATGTFSLNVSLPGTFPAATTITVTSSDPSKIAPEASTVTIPAGSGSATVNFNTFDDATATGPVDVILSASAPGLNNATYVISYLDDEIDHFTFSPVANPQVRGSPFNVAVTACDAAGNPVTGFNRPVAFSAGGVAIEPANLSGFVGGIWTGSVKVNAVATNVSLRVDDGEGRTGVSNAFDVTLGDFTKFEWDPVGPVQSPGSLFPVAVRAVDRAGNTITSVNRPITARALGLATQASVGAGAKTSSFISTSLIRARTEVLYLAGEIGAAKTLHGIALNVATAAKGQVYSNWTIRLKSTTRTVLDSNSGWDGDGWTIVHQSNQTFADKGWVTFQFDRGYDYDGQSNLLVDFSFNNANSYSNTIVWRADASGSNRAMGSSTSSSNWSDPLAWSGLGPEYPQAASSVPQTRFLSFVPIQANLPAAPAISAGAWNGSISVSGVGESYFLEAIDADGKSGLSNRFAVRPPITIPSLPFVDGFEDGKFSAAWSTTPVGDYAPQVTASYSPRTGQGHALLGVNSFPRRHELTLAANLAGYSGVVLKFWAKRHGNSDQGPPPSPFIDGADFDGVAVSADGTQWYEIQPLRGMTSGVWTSFTVNLDAVVASKGLAYNSNFRIRFNQYFNSSPEYDALFIDDVSLTGSPVGRLQIAGPAAISESAGSATGTVSRPAAAESAMIVALESSSPLSLTVPASVTIPAGDTSATFAIMPVDNALRNGDVDVQVTASAQALHAAQAVIKVQDNEVSALSISLPPAVGETVGMVAGTASLSGPAAAGAIAVKLQSSLPGVVQVPDRVVINPGEQAVTFPVTIVADNTITGTQTATVTAIADGGDSVGAQIAVSDDESRGLVLSAASALAEGNSGSLAITLSSKAAFDVVVTLSSADPARVSVPGTFTIPAGTITASCPITAPDNVAKEGPQTITLTASANGFGAAEVQQAVKDNDTSRFEFAALNGPAVRNAPFKVTLSARDFKSETVASYSGAVTLSAFDDSGPLPVSPTSVTLASGSWTGNVTITSFSNSAKLVVSNPSGVTGTSNSFIVGVGPVASYRWSSFPSPQPAGQAIDASITAIDAGGNVATSHNGYVLLSQVVPMAEREVGTGSLQGPTFLLQGGVYDARTQVIYLARELGGSASFTSLSIYVDAPTSRFLPNWTIRMKHTGLSVFSPVAWDANGWKTVHTSSPVISQTGWITFGLQAPFAYDGTSNLMVDFSFDGTASGSSVSTGYYTASENRAFFGSSNSINVSPLTWNGTSPAGTRSTSIPRIRIGVNSTSAPVTPGWAFLAEGVWTGRVWMPGPQASAALNATDFSGNTGTSNSFTVLGPVDSDADKLPNYWESYYALSSSSANDDDGPQGDPDRDGIPNLLELAFELNPRVADVKGLPTAAIRLNPADDKHYLEITFPRLIGFAGLSYQVETADSSMAWSFNPAASELVSVLPSVFSSTAEYVTVRILPAIGTPGMPTKSARVRVLAP